VEQPEPAVEQPEPAVEAPVFNPAVYTTAELKSMAQAIREELKRRA
jgi:hypothetical protein